MSMNLVTVLYLIASICFIQALKGLSHPTTSRRGNLFGMLGMGLAAFTTIALIAMKVSEFQQRGVGIDLAQGLGFVLVGLLVGGSAGAIMAKRVEMTKMPELVAFMHSMIGLAAVFIAIAAVVEPQSLGIVAALGDAIPAGNRLELFLGAAIGAITFSGSVIAFGKLSGKYKFRLFQGAPVVFKGQHLVNLVIAVPLLIAASAGGLTGVALGQGERGDQRRYRQAEHLYFQCIERPSAEAGPKRFALPRSDLAIPTEHDFLSLYVEREAAESEPHRYRASFGK